ncbi:hypothetical protein FHY19_003975 [Xanthomonas arboricola]|nr:hypothetical protein [Xanthomonas sp. 4461]
MRAGTNNRLQPDDLGDDDYHVLFISAALTD